MLAKMEQGFFFLHTEISVYFNSRPIANLGNEPASNSIVWWQQSTLPNVSVVSAYYSNNQHSEVFCTTLECSSNLWLYSTCVYSSFSCHICRYLQRLKQRLKNSKLVTFPVIYCQTHSIKQATKESRYSGKDTVLSTECVNSDPFERRGAPSCNSLWRFCMLSIVQLHRHSAFSFPPLAAMSPDLLSFLPASHSTWYPVGQGVSRSAACPV